MPESLPATAHPGRRACRSMFTRCLLVLASLAWQPLPAGELSRLALAISLAPQPVRTDFAAAAIYETASAFAAEAERARQEGDRARRRELQRWANAVDSYATGLWSIVDGIGEDAAIDIRIGAGGELELGVDGSMVLISGPQPNLQTLFEERILTRFCELHVCTDLLADFQPLQAATTAPAATMRWSFSAGSGPVCSNDEGLEFQFRDTQNLAAKRTACERVIAELEQLVLQIERHKADGVRIEWNHLAIYALGDEPQQRVELNSDGDSLVTAIPALLATERLFALVKPWLAARVNGTQLRQVVINADTLMAPLLAPS